MQKKTEESRRGQNQGESGEQKVNIMNKELLGQWSENGVCSFLQKHRTSDMLRFCYAALFGNYLYDSISL